MALSVEQLLSHHIPAAVIQRWRQRNLSHLLPLQETALLETNYLRGDNLVVFAPTSSGKTFIGETAAARVLSEQRRVVYLVPTRALAEEKFKGFTDLFSPLGHRIVIATSERPESDPLVANGSFDLLIAVYEKMKAFLVGYPQILSQIGLVIVDELHMLGDPSRGDVLDVLLSKIRRLMPELQIIGLSAALGNAREIAEWLGAQLLNHLKRPVELHEGVFNIEDGTFTFRCFNSGEEGIEQLSESLRVDTTDNEFEAYEQALMWLIYSLAINMNEQALVFVPTRHLSRLWAVHFARLCPIAGSERRVNQLLRYEDCLSRDILLECLQHSVGFHNADMTWDLRELVETAYKEGDIRILFSTSTLGQGVNLKGRNVISVHRMVTSDIAKNEYGFAPLTRQRFCNQGGRSARFSGSTEFGRSILIADNAAEAQRLMRYYVHGALEDTNSPLQHAPLERHVLDLIATQRFRTAETIKNFFCYTYTGVRTWNSESRKNDMYRVVDDALRDCYNAGLVRLNERHEFSISGVGEVVAMKGIQPHTALIFDTWWREYGSTRQVPDPLEALLLVSTTPDAATFPIYISFRERHAQVYPAELKKRLIERNLIETWRPRFVEPSSGYSTNDLIMMKKTLLLYDWLDTRITTADLEHQYGVLAGTIRHLAMHYNWLIQSLAQVVAALGGESNYSGALQKIADRLVYGVDESGLSLARLRVCGLTRSAILRLVKEGIDTPHSIISITDEKILYNILPELLAAEVMHAARRYVAASGTRIPPDNNFSCRHKPAASKDTVVKKIKIKKENAKCDVITSKRLIIDCQEPGMIIFDGKRIKLTPLPYKLLLLLARRAEKGATYQEIDESLWPDAKVEQQQISAHKSALIKAFSNVSGNLDTKKIIETHSGFGLILQISSNDIEIRNSG